MVETPRNIVLLVVATAAAFGAFGFWIGFTWPSPPPVIINLPPQGLK